MTRTAQGRWAVIILAILATITALERAQTLLAPLVLAFVCAVVLSPISTFWMRRGLSPVLAALLSLTCVLTLLGALMLFAEPVAERAYAQIPALKLELREQLYELRHILRGLKDVAQDVQETISPASSGADGQGGDAMALPSLGDALFAVPALAGQILLFAGSLYFILLSRDEVYEGLARLHPDGPSVACLRGADIRVSKYFLTISLINICFGALVAGALWAIGMPGAVIWGFVAALMNFMPYVGPALVALVLVVAGAMAFDGLAALGPAAVFLGLNTLEGQFVTPTLVGRHMQVSPLLIFLSLCFWLWLWGPVGGFVAIPILVWGLAVFDGLGPDPALEAAEALQETQPS